MHFYSIVSRNWKTNFKTVIGILSLFAIVLILPRPVDAFQTALVRATDGNVYQIRFPNGDLNGRYSISDFIDNFFIYNETGEVKLCPGIDEPVTRELYTAAWVLANTPRNTPLFDASTLNDALIETAEDIGIDQEGNVKVQEILREITEEMIVDEVQGRLDQFLSKTVGTPVSIDLRTLEIKYKNPLEIISERIAVDTDEPLILAKSVEFLRRLMDTEIEYHGMMYAFSKANEYAIIARTLQRLGNYRAAALWDAINAGDVVDITGITFITVHEESVEISDNIGVFDPWGLRLAAQVYQDYAERAGELGTDVGKNPEVLETVLIQTQPINMIKQLLLAIGSAQDVIELKDTVDQLEVQLPNDVKRKLHENIIGIYNSASSDLTAHGFCAPDLRFTAIPPTVPEGDTLTYTVALNSAPSFVAIIAISSDNPDVTVSPTSLTFTPNNWYIPKSVVVDVSSDADSIDESVSLKHIVVGYGGGMVREIRLDITDHVRNQAPQRVNEIPAQSLTIGSASPPLELSIYFHDPDGDKLLYAAESSDKTVATTQRTGSEITILPQGIGTATITVTAANSEGPSATQTFTVTVTAVLTQTQPPEQVGTIPTQYMTLDGGAKTVDVASYFSSSNTLSYTVTTSPLGFVTASISGSRVTLTPLQAGSTSVFVTARDSQHPDLSALQTIPVSVSHAIIVLPPTPDPFTPPTTNPDVEGLREGISVITQLTGAFRLNVRERPGTDEEIVEQLGSGVIGAITDGPVRADGFRWWEIKWEIRGLDLEGWSAESDRGQILFRRPADLEIQDLDVSEDEVEPGDRFTVEVRVRNNGPGESAPTEVSVYYSLERHSNRLEFDADRNKYEVGTIRIPSLREGRRTERSVRVDAPQLPGRYYFGGYMPSNIHPTDYTRDLPSDARENDLAPQERVTVTTAPDLIVASISSNQSVLDPGETFRLEATVRNQGIGEPENNATLRYYQASNVNISTSDTEVGSDSVYRGDLDTNGTEDESISLTAPIKPGVYYYGACVDRVENESNTRNNCSGAIAITVRELAPQLMPDLVALPPTVSASSLAPGESFTLETTVENRGTGDSAATPLRYYLSTDATISDADTEVYATILPIVAVNATDELSSELIAPDTPGVYYYGVCVDAVANESDTTNNCSTAVAITVENRAPNPVGTLPSRTLSENDAPIAIDIAQYFDDPDNTALTYAAVSDNTAVVLAQMAGNEMTLTPLGAGDATVTVTASDGALTATQTLSISVVAVPTENEAPMAIGVIPVQALTIDGASSTVDISAYFSDANGDALTYAAWPDDKNVVGLRREGTLLTIRAKAAGRATVTVRARDPEGLEAFQRFSVLVSDSEVPVTDMPAETWMSDANLRAAVRNALGLARNAPLTQQAMLRLTSLRYLGPDLNHTQKIADLTGLEYALNLEHLDLYAHLISDLRPLEKLAKLRSLWLAGNKITNIRPLTNLPLEELDLGGNPINNFAPLAELTSLTRLDLLRNGLGDNNLHLIVGLTQLTRLDLRNNQISDISSLTKLGNLKKLQLEGNPITDTSPLLNLTSQNPDLEIDIEMGEGPPSELDTDVEPEVPDLIVESIRARKTTVAPGDVFRVDAVIKNQGKAASGAAKVHFYRSPDETITTEDTKGRTSEMPALAADSTKNRWARLTAPDTPGVYYYGVCIEGVENESDTENNCSTAVKITVGTSGTEPPTVETPVTPAPETDVAPPPTADGHWMPDANLRAAVRKALGLKPSETLTQQAMRKLTRLDVQLSTKPVQRDQIPAKDEIKYITGLEHATQLTELVLAFHQISDLTPLKNLTALTNLSIWGCEVSDLTPLKNLTSLTYLGFSYNQISDLTPLKNLTALTTLFLEFNQISDITPLKNLTALTGLALGYNEVNDLTPLKSLTTLWWLNLESNKVRDLTPLKSLTTLRQLGVGSNQVRDIIPLTGLKSLESLSLFNMEIDDNYFASLVPLLTSMTNLRRLSLGFNRISNARLLAGLTRLRDLDIRYNQISDVRPLETFVNLEVLDIKGNPIADLAPLRRLKAKNPNLKIDIDLNTGAAPSAAVLPDETDLFSNYPNPFNPETWIPYQLAASADVTLTIYDVRGVVVRRLELGHRPPGFYYSRGSAAHWDGRNSIGEKVASGLYFYTFTAGDFTATQKLLILK